MAEKPTELVAYEDPGHEGNGAKHLTGKPCIEKGCDNPAGTAWSPFWCFACNVKRIRRIDAGFAAIGKAFDDGD